MLVVDDEADGQRLCAMVSRQGYDASLVTSGAAALQRLEADRDDIDLILAELYMPDVSGWVLLQTVKQRRLKAHVVLLTGNLSLEAERMLTDLNADGYLTKPVDRRRLEIILHALLSTEGLDRATDVVAVDGDRDNLRRIESILGDAGVFTNGYWDVVRAEVAVEQDPPHLLITEVQIGRHSGLDLCERIRRSRRLPYIPILAMSSLPTRDTVDRAARLNVNGFLVKPIDETVLRDRALRLLKHTKPG